MLILILYKCLHYHQYCNNDALILYYIPDSNTNVHTDTTFLLMLPLDLSQITMLILTAQPF